MLVLQVPLDSNFALNMCPCHFNMMLPIYRWLQSTLAIVFYHALILKYHTAWFITQLSHLMTYYFLLVQLETFSHPESNKHCLQSHKQPYKQNNGKKKKDKKRRIRTMRECEICLLLKRVKQSNPECLGQHYEEYHYNILLSTTCISGPWGYRLSHFNIYIFSYRKFALKFSEYKIN